MDERQAFIDAIQNDPLDMDLRKVFADWLDEHDEPELADLHRSMTKEKYQRANDYFDWFCQQHPTRDGDEYAREFEDQDYDSPDRFWSRDQILDCGHRYLNRDEDYQYFDYLTQIGSESARTDMAYSNYREEFWKHFEILSGQIVPPDKKDDHFFSCSC